MRDETGGTFETHFYKRVLLAIASGVIYSGAFPPIDFGWLVVVGFGGLLFSLKGAQGVQARAIGLAHGLAAYGVGLSWLWNLFGLAAIALWFILALFTVFFAEFQARAIRVGLRGYGLVVFTAINWGAWEFLRCEVFPLRFPWMSVGLGLGPNYLIPYVGVYGVGFLTVGVIAGFFAKRWAVSVVVGVLLVGVVFSYQPGRIAVEKKDQIKVGGVQLEGVSLNEYLGSSQGFPDDVEHIVWPEYAVPYDIRRVERDWKLLLDLCKAKDATLTFGTQFRDPEGQNWRNIAMTLDAEGYRGEHTKVHTVHFFDDGLRGLKSEPVRTINGLVGTPICFDFDYTNVARRMVLAGAEYFVVPTMDAESWSVRQHEQHAELARMRAAENGRWAFVVASSGVSQLIDSRGFVREGLGAMEQGSLVGVLQRRDELTFFTQFGWVLPWCIFGAAVPMWLWLLWMALHRRGLQAK